MSHERYIITIGLLTDMSRCELEGLLAEIVTDGLTDPRAGLNIAITGLGVRFDGTETKDYR